MGKLRRLAAVVTVACMLCGCNGFSLTTEDLMRPPQLTAEQQAIEVALRESVLSNDISYKYPKKGDYRSAYIFHDVDGDGANEALVFYSADVNGYARLSILDQQPDGSWQALRELAGPQKDVEFVSFSHITSQTLPDIVVGWSNTDRKELELGVYSFEDETFRNRADNGHSFHEHLIADLDADGLDEIVLFIRNAANSLESAWISLLDYDGYKIELADELPLSPSIVKFVSSVSGRLTSGSTQKAVFVDEQLTGRQVVTEVFTVRDGLLKPVIYSDAAFNVSTPALTPGTDAAAPQTADAGEPFAATLTPAGPYDLYLQTERSDMTASCEDVNRDSVIEIPTGRLLPGYGMASSEDGDKKNEDSERMYLTIYNQLRGGHLTQLFSSAVNWTAGYRLDFPQRWENTVTIVNEIETNEWRVIEYDSTLKNPLDALSNELLRIRVVSQKDYQDSFLKNYTVLATRGTFTYYAYVPPAADGPLAVTIEEVQQQMFSLL